MNAMPHPYPDHSEPAAPAPGGTHGLASAIPVSLSGASNKAPGAPPPHLLWETLESAYAAPADAPPEGSEERMAPYIALPMAVGLSLVLWVIIVELVLMR